MTAGNKPVFADRLITASEAAEILNIRLERFYSLVRNGAFKNGEIIRFGKRQIRVSFRGLESWIRQGGTSAE